ncbi:hypothetical protein D3C81_647890 [compost metagenome]
MLIDSRISAIGLTERKVSHVSRMMPAREPRPMVDISPAAWLLAAAACRITPALMISTPATACRAAASACASTGSALSCAPSEKAGRRKVSGSSTYWRSPSATNRWPSRGRTGVSCARSCTQPLNRPKGSSCQAPSFGPPNGLYNWLRAASRQNDGASWRSCASCGAASSVRRCCWNRASQSFCVCSSSGVEWNRSAWRASTAP